MKFLDRIVWPSERIRDPNSFLSGVETLPNHDEIITERTDGGYKETRRIIRYLQLGGIPDFRSRQDFHLLGEIVLHYHRDGTLFKKDVKRWDVGFSAPRLKHRLELDYDPKRSKWIGRDLSKGYSGLNKFVRDRLPV